ncbi:uncharacterized protein LOC108607012 [Drosophila busckii]|nr:uncharacterized protein LOC108607012 [Drosophila busckii]
MTMRLNLHHILKNQLRDSVGDSDSQEQAHLAQKAALRLGPDRLGAPYASYFAQKPDMRTRVQSMMHNIHQHMKTTAPPRKSVPAIPAAIAEIPVPPTDVAASKKGKRIKGGGVSKNSLPISQIKARLNHQSQQVLRRGLGDMGQKNFANQRRIREVLLQKSVLENMLLQHKRLQRDRQTIALDIQRMRQDLDKIKNKLDTSIQALNSTRTMYNGMSKSRKNLLPMALPIASTPKLPRINSKATSRSPGGKSSNIITKRQHSASPPRRRRH